MLTSGLAYKNLSSVHNSISMHNSVIVVFTGSFTQLLSLLINITASFFIFYIIIQL